MHQTTPSDPPTGATRPNLTTTEIYGELGLAGAGSGIRFSDGTFMSTAAGAGGSNPVFTSVKAGTSVFAAMGNHPNYGNNYAAFWRDGVDYALLADAANTFLNCPAGGQVWIRRGNVTKGEIGQRVDFSPGLEPWVAISDLGAWGNTGQTYSIPLQARRDNDGIAHVMGRSVIVGSSFTFPVQVAELPWITTKNSHLAGYGWTPSTNTWSVFMVRLGVGTNDLLAYTGTGFTGEAGSVFDWNFLYPTV